MSVRRRSGGEGERERKGGTKKKERDGNGNVLHGMYEEEEDVNKREEREKYKRKLCDNCVCLCCEGEK